MFSRCLLNAYSLPGTVLTNTVGRKAEVLLPSEDAYSVGKTRKIIMPLISGCARCLKGKIQSTTGESLRGRGRDSQRKLFEGVSPDLGGIRRN